MAMLIPPRQRGAAIITALLVVLLAATLAAYLLSQQSQALTRTARGLDRAQAMLFVPPMLQWTRSALFEFQKNNTSVDLSQRWAQPIAVQPLEGASASGFFRDESGRFNVNNLLKDDGARSEPDIIVFKNLLENLKLNPELAHALVDWIDADSETTFPGGAEDATYLAKSPPYRAANQRMLQIDELARVAGFDNAALAALRPFITALPERSKININTAPEEVIHAALPELDNAGLSELLKRRLSQPFKSLADDAKTPGTKGVKSYLKDVPPEKIDQLIDVNSRHFLVALGITAGDTKIHQSALLQRVPTNAANKNAEAWPRIIWVKDD